MLYLIKKNELDICDIAISQVTDQYLEYIELMKQLDLDLVGDFLVLAATLMQIKSRELLPPDPQEVEQEDITTWTIPHPNDPQNQMEPY